MSNPLESRVIELGKHVVRMTTAAGSGHPSSALSLGHLVAALMYSEMRYDPANPWNPASDRLVLMELNASDGERTAETKGRPPGRSGGHSPSAPSCSASLWRSGSAGGRWRSALWRASSQTGRTRNPTCFPTCDRWLAAGRLSGAIERGASLGEQGASGLGVGRLRMLCEGGLEGGHRRRVGPAVELTDRAVVGLDEPVVVADRPDVVDLDVDPERWTGAASLAEVLQEEQRVIEPVGCDELVEALDVGGAGRA